MVIQIPVVIMKDLKKCSNDRLGVLVKDLWQSGDIVSWEI